MSRLSFIKAEGFNSDQQAMFDAITSGKRATSAGVSAFLTPEGGLHGPFHPWLYAPKTGNLVQRLGECIRYEGVLSDRQREIGILCTAAHWRAQYEWLSHSRIARDCGVSDSIIETIRQRRQPEFDDPGERAVHDLARSTLDQGNVPDALYRQAVTELGEESLVELVMLRSLAGVVEFWLPASAPF